MNKILTVATISSLLFLASCGGKKPETLEGKKARLDSLKTQQDKLAIQIDTLEAQISRLDTSSVVGKKAKLVALTTVSPVSFTHLDTFRESQRKDSDLAVLGTLVLQVRCQQNHPVMLPLCLLFIWPGLVGGAAYTVYSLLMAGI